ncbi:proto-oncogene tyrosine-protein kinase ROS-like [Notamacropus eugenii]|uniref:proto-oncogene tyrosine-protein kinase ROS-like n=1 Tax=Notamacropus eugenii TaxID=9315 RepID=UPI003B675F4A
MAPSTGQIQFGNVYVTYLNDPDFKTQRMKTVQHAQALAIDWISNTLYRSEKKGNWILLMPLDAEIPENLIMASGRIIDLQLDPLEGYVYWTTIHTVECSLLNGFYPAIVMEESSVSNRQFAGLTVDFEHMMFYWLVQDNFGVEIYQAELCKKRYCMRTSVSKIISIDLMRLSYPVLQYYSGRFAWISQANTIYSLELANSQKTEINKGTNLTTLTTFTVVQPKPLPGPCYT